MNELVEKKMLTNPKELTNQYYCPFTETNPVHVHVGGKYTRVAQGQNCTGKKKCIYNINVQYTFVLGHSFKDRPG